MKESSAALDELYPGIAEAGTSEMCVPVYMRPVGFEPDRRCGRKACVRATKEVKFVVISSKNCDILTFEGSAKL